MKFHPPLHFVHLMRNLDFGVLRKAKLALVERIGQARRESQTPETQMNVYWLGAGKLKRKSQCVLSWAQKTITEMLA